MLTAACYQLPSTHQRLVTTPRIEIGGTLARPEASYHAAYLHEGDREQCGSNHGEHRHGNGSREATCARVGTLCSFRHRDYRSGQRDEKCAAGNAPQNNDPFAFSLGDTHYGTPQLFGTTPRLAKCLMNGPGLFRAYNC